MITSGELLPRILVACPGFREDWERSRQLSGAEERGLYIQLTDVADYVVRSYARETTSELPSFFEAIEQLLGEGDEDVREAVSIGLLEDIQSLASHEAFPYQVFEKWLGPRGKTAWARAELAWLGKNSLAGVLRAESGLPPELEAIPDISKIENPELAKMLRATYRIPSPAKKKPWWKIW